MNLFQVSLSLVAAACCSVSAHASFLVDPTGGTVLWSDKLGADNEVRIGRSLGFAFSFFGGDTVTAIDVSVNGHLNFSGNSDYSNETAILPVPRISPLWDDLRVAVGSGDSVIEKVVAGKYYSVTWRARQAELPAATPHAFQVVLFGKAMRVNGIDFYKDDIVFAYEKIGTPFDKKTATVALDPGDPELVLRLPGTLSLTGQLSRDEAAGLLPLGPGGFVLYRFDGIDSYSVTVFGNRPPRARDDTVYTARRAEMLIAALANDDDPDDDPKSVAALGTPGFGTVTADANGVLHYLPSPSFTGSDTFSYTIEDPSHFSSTAQVHIVPFAPNKGTFDGFLRDAPTEDEPNPEISIEGAGFIRITMRPDGTFTGRVILGGYGRSLVGTFDPQGNWGTTFDRVVDEQPQTVKLTLHLDLLNLIQPLTGRIEHDDTASLITGARSLFRADSAPAPQAGPYKVLLLPDENFAGPAGFGYATMTVTKSGGVTIAGKLGNGRLLANSGSVKPDGTFPFYLHFPGRPGTRAGAAWGMVKFDDSDPTSDCSAVVRWVMPDIAPDGEFDALQTLVGDRFTPVVGHRLLDLADGPKNATIDFGANAEVLTIDPENRVTVEEGGDEKLLVTINPATGCFSGSFVEEVYDPRHAFKTRKLNGVFLKKRNIGGGLFIGADRLAAPVLIQPPLPEPE